MKRGWIALGMIALALLLGGVEYIYVTSNADAYIKMLDSADEKMMHNEVLDAETEAEKLDNRFRKQSGMFNIFMFHSEVGHISSDLAMLRQYARNADTEDFLATSACARRKIQDIKNAKLMKWENIL